jgi:hypothetical protein
MMTLLNLPEVNIGSAVPQDVNLPLFRLSPI